MKTVASTGNIKTTDKTNVSMTGRMIESTITIQEVFGFTFVNKLDLLSSMLGYYSRHLTPMFLNIWFSGYNNLHDDELTNGKITAPYQEPEARIGNIQYIYRGVLTDVKTTTSTSTETIYEAKFNSDNYSTDDKCFDACFAASKPIEIEKNTTNILGDIALDLQKQLNESFLNQQDIVVRRHIYGYYEIPISFVIYNLDDKIIFDGRYSETQLLYNGAETDRAYMNSRDASIKEQIKNLEEQRKKAKEAMDDNKHLVINPGPVLQSSVGNIIYTPGYQLASEQYKVLSEQIEQLSDVQKNDTKPRKKVQNAYFKTIEEKIEEMNKDKKNKYGTSAVNIDNGITENIKSNPFVWNKDRKISISCDGQTIDNIFNSILMNYIVQKQDSELNGIGACCNIVPHFLSEYNGKCYYSYIFEIRLVKVPGLDKLVKQQEKYLTNSEVKTYDFAELQYGFLRDIEEKFGLFKTYKFMYNGTDISVLEYNTDMSQLYYMDTGSSLYKYILSNKMDMNKNESDNTFLNVLKRKDRAFLDGYNDQKSVIDTIISVSKSKEKVYMEDIWNTLMRNPEYDNIVKQMMDENYMQVAIGTNPIVDINDESTNIFSMKKIAWNDIFNVACQTATIKIIGDPFWIAPNIPFSNYNSQLLYTGNYQTFPVILFTYTPFIEQQDDDTFKINDDYRYKMPYLVTEVNSLFEGGQFTQELVCIMPQVFMQNTSLNELNKKSYAEMEEEEKMLKKKRKEEQEKINENFKKTHNTYMVA